MRRSGPTGAIVLCLVGSALVLLAGARPWLATTVRLSSPTADRPDAFLLTEAQLDAGDVRPVSTPLGLLGLAGVAAIAGSRGRGRQLVGVLLLAAGAIVCAAAATVPADPMAAAGEPAVDDVALRDGPWLALVGGLAVAGGGAMTARSGSRWRALGAAYTTPASTRSAGSGDPGELDDLAAAWRAAEEDDQIDPEPDVDGGPRRTPVG